MDLSALEAIDDPQALRTMLRTAQATIAEQSEQLAARDRTIVLRETQNATLKAEIARLKRLQFAAHTERMDPDQRQLFDASPARTPGAGAARHEPTSCTCPQCQGALVQIGEHLSERLACKPLQFYVKQDVYPQYACRACEQIVAAPVAPSILERDQADASLLAQVAVAEYVDHLPL